MAGIWRVLAGSVTALFIFGSGAEAFQGRFGLWWSPSSYSSYYYAPTYSYYCPPVTMAPLTVAPARGTIYAVPSAAPPSQTIEPPLQKPPMPSAKASDELRSPALVAASPAESSQNDRIRVGFWNLSGRDRTLTIAGKSWVVPQDRAITLELARRFAWQLEERPQRVERVPEGQATYDVVIRD